MERITIINSVLAFNITAINSMVVLTVDQRHLKEILL